jgi:hypothetical protein
MKSKLETYVKTYEDPEIDENGKLIVKLKSGNVGKKDHSNDDNKGRDDNHDENNNNGEDEDVNDLADLKA